MSGISSIEIAESKEILQQMLQEQKNLRNQQRVQVLFLLKSEKMSISKISEVIGRHRGTVHKWLMTYRDHGLKKLLTERAKTGRPRKIPEWAVKSLEKQLGQPEGFKSYTQIQRWLETTLGIEAAYRTVHELTRYRLKAKLKVGKRPYPGQDKVKIEAFKKTLPQT